MSIHDKRRPVVNNCEKATFLIEKKKFTAISPGDERMLQTHLERCAECRIYDRQSKLIDLIAQQVPPEQLQDKELDASFKQQLQQQINQKLGKDS